MNISLLSGYRLSSQIVCEAIEQVITSRTYLYRIPPERWLQWIGYRIKKYGLLTLLGHLELSAYLRLRALLRRITNKKVWAATSSYKQPTNTIIVQSETELKKRLQDSDIVILIEPFRLPRKVYSRRTTIFLEIAWGSVPNFRGDSAGWWEKVIERSNYTEVGILRRLGDATEFEILATWRVPLESADTIGQVRLRQAEILRANLPEFLKSYLSGKQHFKRIYTQKIAGYSYISPTLREYLRYNARKSVSPGILTKRRTKITYTMSKHS